MEGILAIYGNPYMLTGVIVSILFYRRLSSSLANSSSVWTGSYWATVSRRQKKKPGIGDYFFALVWSIILIPVWPVRVLFKLWLAFSK